MTFLARQIRGVPGLFFITIIAIFACIASAWAKSDSGQKKPAKTMVVIHCDYPPVSFWDKNADSPSGFFVDIMDSVARRAGLQVGYICKNGWAEMVDTIESGEADLGALMKSEEREKKLMFSAPIEVSYLSYFARSQSIVNADRVPEGYTVGVVKGSMSYERLKNLPQLSLLIYSSYQDGLFGLLSGEIALFAGEESMILKRARETRLEDRIKKVGKPFSERERALAVKKDNVQLLQLLNKALQGFTASPEYQRIYLKWYGAPTPYWTNKRVLTAGGVFLIISVCGMALWRYISIARINKELVRNIDERKQIEEALQESEMRYRSLFEQSGDYIIVMRITDNGPPVITDMNETALRAHGYLREEILGKPITLLDPDTDSSIHDERIKALKNGGLGVFTVQHRRRDGSLFDVEVRAQIVQVGLDQFILSSERDVTVRRQTEAALMQSEKKYRELVETANSVILTWDTEGNITFLNDYGEKFFGFSKDELLGKNVVGTIVPRSESSGRDLKGLMEEIQKMPDNFRDNENENITKDGRRVWVRWANRAILNENGATVGILSIGYDITQHRQAEAVLRKRERQLAESQRLAHIGSWEHNLSTDQVVWSDELFRLLGLNPGKDEANIQTFLQIVHPDDLDDLKKAIKETVELQKPFSIDYRFILRDGTHRVLHAQAELTHDDAGKQVVLRGTGQDITDRKQADEALRQKEEMMRNLLDGVDEGFIVIDRHYRILTANRAYCNQVGLEPANVLGKHCFELSHRVDRPCFENGEECATRLVFETGEPHVSMHRHVDHGGEVIFVEAKAFPLKDSSGQVTSVIEVINNITEKQLLEEQRLKTQKLEAVGTLAGGIAHDFNNLLQGVFGYISMARMTVDQRQKCLDMLEQAEKALHMSVNLTNQLLTFSKGGKPVRKKMQLRPLIENSVKFALSGSRVDYKLEFDDALWMVEADEGQIGQVIQNIVLNAEQAMPLGGTVTIKANNVRALQKGLPPVLPQGNYVQMSMSDNGMGIPEDYLPKIFDPYFTTKEKGSGLGLATSYSIIKNHGGILDVESVVGKGSTFFIWLPAAEAVEAKAESLPGPGPAVGKRRILLMDDEEIVRNIAGEMISSLGHEVELVASGEEAIEKCQSANQLEKPFDLLIFDLTIRGGMGGIQTLDKLRETYPTVKAIVSSGYAEDSSLSEYGTHGFVGVLKKPYTLGELQAVLNEALK
jgi:PAS domain S-box-containing protein